MLYPIDKQEAKLLRQLLMLHLTPECDLTTHRIQDFGIHEYAMLYLKLDGFIMNLKHSIEPSHE